MAQLLVMATTPRGAGQCFEVSIGTCGSAVLNGGAASSLRAVRLERRPTSAVAGSAAVDTLL
eukprot:scaffold7320_cov139-Isochrysis_galbana.AAC.8